MAGTQRYWDGGGWSEHVAPAQTGSSVMTATPSEVAAEKRHNASIHKAGIFFAFFCPVIGFVIGLTQINKRGGDGVGIMCLSVFMTFVWFMLISGG